MLVPLVKRKEYFMGDSPDRLKMNMDKAWNINFVATPKKVASMTMKGQTKPIFSVSLTGVIAEEEQHV